MIRSISEAKNALSVFLDVYLWIILNFFTYLHAFLLKITNKLHNIFYYNSDKKSQLLKRIKEAENYSEWKAAAIELDNVSHAGVWKRTAVSDEYDYELITSRIELIRGAIRKSDFEAMKFLLRISLSRNFANINHPSLFSHAQYGTKQLIDEYIQVMKQLLDLCAEFNPSHWNSIIEQAEFLKLIRRAYGNTALLLSGGAAFGMHHIGVIKCLFEQDRMPRIINGSSAGSILAAMLCTRSDEEFIKILDGDSLIELGIQLEKPMTPNTEGRSKSKTIQRLITILQEGVVFNNEILIKGLRDNLGDMTFLEAYYHTRKILNISVSSATTYEIPKILNYLSTPTVVIWSAVVASCAIPGFFKSFQLMTKGVNGILEPLNMANQSWIDGTVENDLPMNRLGQIFNVNHFIVSQVNPFAVPFLQKTLQPGIIEIVCRKFLSVVKNELLYRLPKLIDLGFQRRFCHVLISVLSQRYCGDITIIPNFKVMEDFVNVFESGEPKFLALCMRRGERDTWPKVSMILNHTELETKLDEIMLKMHARLFEITAQNPDFDLEEYYLDPRPPGLDPAERKNSSTSQESAREAKEKIERLAEIQPIELRDKFRYQSLRWSYKMTSTEHDNSTHTTLSSKEGKSSINSDQSERESFDMRQSLEIREESTYLLDEEDNGVVPKPTHIRRATFMHFNSTKKSRHAKEKESEKQKRPLSSIAF